MRYFLLAWLAVMVGCDDSRTRAPDTPLPSSSEEPSVSSVEETAATSRPVNSAPSDDANNPPNDTEDVSPTTPAAVPQENPDSMNADNAHPTAEQQSDDESNDDRASSGSTDMAPAPSHAGPQAAETDQSGSMVANLRRPLEDEARLTIRPLRRMNVDQLNAAMRSVSGGIGWTERRNNADVDIFVQLASTLGKPDYAFATEEELEATVIFQKFLDDAARSICTKMLIADLEAFEAEANGEQVESEPRLLIHVGPDDTLDTDYEAVIGNLQTLLSRFHGRVVTDPNAPLLHQWQWLHRTGTFVTGDPAEAWLGVCVALFTHPHFYMY